MAALDDDFETHVRAVEAMAQRLSEAAKVFREARLMLGGGTVAVDASQGAAPSPAFVPGRPPTRTIGDFNGFTPQEIAERERLKRRNMGEDLPAGIRELEAEQ